MSNRQKGNTARQLSQIQRSLSVLFETIKDQLLMNHIIQSQQQLNNIFSSTQINQYQDLYYTQNISNIINYLIAMLIEQKDHNQSIIQQLNQNIQQLNLNLQDLNKQNIQLNQTVNQMSRNMELMNQDIMQLNSNLTQMNSVIQDNDKRVLLGLEIFVDLTQRMAQFSKDIYKQRQQKSLPVQICKHFRQVYQLTQELSNIFNQYNINNQQSLIKRDELIALQIKCMQGVFMDQQNEGRQINQRNLKALDKINRNKAISQQTQQYIIQLRQQINHLHQTLLKNDQQFTIQIQNYNKTVRQLSNTIKAYELQFAKITSYQIKIQQLQKMIVRLREDKYKNQIVIENMAKKIRNFQKELKGDKAFLSPHRQRLVSSPQSKFSMLNSKVSSALSVMNSINNSNNLLSPNKKPLY